MSLSTIPLLGSVQAAFLVVLILGKRRKTLSDAVLAVWMAVLGIHHLLYVLLDRGVALPAAWLNLSAGVPLLQGPFLYLYVETLISGRTRLRVRDLAHLTPFGLFALYTVWVLPSLGPVHGSTVSVFRLSILVTAAILVSVPAYAFTALVRLRNHRLRTLDRHSEPRGRDLSWLRWIVLALLAVWGVVLIVVALEYLAPGTAQGLPRHKMMSAVTLFIYVIGYFGFRQITVSEPEEATGATAAPSPGPEPGKYRRSGLTDEDAAALVVRLERYLDERKPHLQEGVTLREVAAGLEVSPNHLSQAINQRLGKNFYVLINERRVEEFKRRAVDPENRAYTLLAIALDSGFSSKSSFNRIFKQFTGISPKQYVEQQASPDARTGG